MNTTAHPKAFCARPGCGIAYAIHETTATACKNYIDPTSEAGRAARELTKVVDSSDLRSDTIDRAQLRDINKAQWAAIRKAKGLLLLALDADHPTMFRIHCHAALMVLRGIGDA